MIKVNAKKRVLLEVFRRNQGEFLNANDIFREAEKITGQHNLPFKNNRSLVRCLCKFHYTKKPPKKTNEATKYYCPSIKELNKLGIKTN